MYGPARRRRVGRLAACWRHWPESGGMASPSDGIRQECEVAGSPT
jgi:hypothetical protein